MNKRQRKKRDSKGIILIFRCEALYRQEDYANMGRTIKAQLNKDNLIVLPPQLTLEGIAGGSRVNKIKITKEVEPPDWIYSDIPTYNNIDYEKVEAALGFKLFIWQKTLIEHGEYRQSGRTTAQILRELLTNTEQELVLQRPHSIREETEQRQLLEIYKKLKENGIKCKTVRKR